MRIINKKYLLIILLIGIILTGVIILKPKEKVQLDNVILKQEVNNKTFAMYTETDNGYEEYKDTKFPDMYVLNLTESKCIDNNGNELKNVLSYENDKVTITSGNTTYCYLYFDKSIGLEIKETNPNKLSEEIKGAMYRFQGQQTDEVQNYICFGTSDLEECTANPDKHMYRIIGIEAETGRVKVIKKEALNEAVQWWDNFNDDIEFPKSRIYEIISGNGFLKNDEYVPEGWKKKIANNTWVYGDMNTSNINGSTQTGEGLYQTESAQKGTTWSIKVDQSDPEAKPFIVDYVGSPYKDKTFYYKEYKNEKWTRTFNLKISLIYLNDYYYSVSDTISCHSFDHMYPICVTGWMHLSQNDPDAPSDNEWSMSRFGWTPSNGWYNGYAIASIGAVFTNALSNKVSIRPVFYLASVNELAGGSGKPDDPFIIK